MYKDMSNDKYTFAALFLCILVLTHNRTQSVRAILYFRVRNCAFLVANVTKHFALASRISQLVASWRFTTLFHATIITQTIALIFSQIDQNKIQSRPPIGHFLFTFPLLWKYKTDFLLL